MYNLKQFPTIVGTRYNADTSDILFSTVKSRGSRNSHRTATFYTHNL